MINKFKLTVFKLNINIHIIYTFIYLFIYFDLILITLAREKLKTIYTAILLTWFSVTLTESVYHYCYVLKKKLYIQFHCLKKKKKIKFYYKYTIFMIIKMRRKTKLFRFVNFQTKRV